MARDWTTEADPLTAHPEEPARPSPRLLIFGLAATFLLWLTGVVQGPSTSLQEYCAPQKLENSAAYRHCLDTANVDRGD